MGLCAVGVRRTPGLTAPSSPKIAPQPQNTRAGALLAAKFKLSSDMVLRPRGGYSLSNTTQEVAGTRPNFWLPLECPFQHGSGPGRPVCVMFSSLNKWGFLPQNMSGCMCDRVPTGSAGPVRLRACLAGGTASVQAPWWTCQRTKRLLVYAVYKKGFGTTSKK